jgi:uncharacterized protein (DUF2164 family)
MKKITFTREETALIVDRLQAYLREEFDTTIGNMQAELFVQFLAEDLGPHFYNRGLRDAQAALAARLEDFGDDIYGLEQKPPRRR